MTRRGAVGLISAGCALATGLAFVAPGAQAAPKPSLVTGHGRVNPQHVADHGVARTAGRTSVTLGLTAHDPATVARLGHESHVRGVSRVRQLASALATPRAESAVKAWLSSHGLTVDATSSVAVTASGPTALVATLFPTTAASRTAASRTTVASRPSAAVIPSVLGNLVDYALLSSTPRHLAQPLMARPHVGPAGASATYLTGALGRSTYGIPSTAATTDGKLITIATLQFSGWDATNLTSFAAAKGLPDPVASSYYQAISVDGADPTTPSGNGNDIEVALDQETLLDIAPQAVQIAYVAPNSDQGWVDGINAVTADALNNTAGLRYTALSISWGLCEAYWTSPGISAVHTALTNLVAAGVTVFVAAGDSGAYDCSKAGSPDNALAVDYPASDPNVLAVGGLTTDFTGPAESVWWDTTAANVAGYAGGGGGGGLSQMWPQPSWQANSGTAVGDGSSRLLPDISLDADPTTGEQILDGSWQVVGGTSLAAPLAAATLTDLQIIDGADSSYGLGNIAPNLYAAPDTAFRDTVAGGNGGWSATVGYDLASGLGAPLWTNLDSALLGAPNMSTPATSKSRAVSVTTSSPAGMSYTGYRGGVGVGTEPATCDATGASSTPPATITTPADGTFVLWLVASTDYGHCYIAESTTIVDTVAPRTSTLSASVVPLSAPRITWHWASTDPSPASGIHHFHVVVTRADNSAVVFSGNAGTALVTSGVPGVTYFARVQAVDRAGNTGPVAVGRATVPYPATTLRYSTGWVRRSDVGAPGGRAEQTSKAGASATLRVRASFIIVYGLALPSGGLAAAYVDGRLVATLNLHATVAKPAVGYVIARFASVGPHTVVIRALGRHAAGASGNTVILEALLARG